MTTAEVLAAYPWALLPPDPLADAESLSRGELAAVMNAYDVAAGCCDPGESRNRLIARAKLCCDLLTARDAVAPEGFATTLRRLREAAGHTLADLGDAAGLSRQRVHQLEAGQYRPSWAEVQALATALGMSTEAFRDPE